MLNNNNRGFDIEKSCYIYYAKDVRAGFRASAGSTPILILFSRRGSTTTALGKSDVSVAGGLTIPAEQDSSEARNRLKL